MGLPMPTLYVVWVKDAPKFGVNEDSEVTDFIDQYITCAKPEDGKLRELVLLLQEHKHSTYCKKGLTCRFISLNLLVQSH